MKALFVALAFTYAAVCVRAQSPSKVDLPMVYRVQRYLDLTDVPDQRMQEILEVQLEFMPGPNWTQQTTLGHWIVGMINTLDYGQALRGGLKNGEFFRRREEYFNRLLDRKLDPVNVGKGQARSAAAEIFVTWGDQLAGGHSFGVLNDATDLFLKSIEVCEVYEAFRQVFEQERDRWMVTYFDARDSGESDDQAWALIEPSITFRVDKPKLWQFFRTSYDAYLFAANPVALKNALRAMLETLMPWKNSPLRFLNSSWSGLWMPEHKCANAGPFPPAPFTIELKSDSGFILGTIQGSGIYTTNVRGIDTGNRANLTIEWAQSAAGTFSVQMQGMVMTGRIDERPIQGLCDWQGPFQAKLTVIRGVPARADCLSSACK